MALNFGEGLFQESPEDNQVKVFGDGETYQDFLNKVATLAADAAVKAIIALETGTYYWTAPACMWLPEFEDDAIERGGNNMNSVGGSQFYLPVTGIPNGAVITAVICYGSAGTNDETWTLYRYGLATGRSSMATENFNSTDSSISLATIDNNNYVYAIESSTLTGGDELTGVRITYTI